MAATVSIRIEEGTHTKLQELAQAEHKLIGEVVKAAVDRYRQECFFADYNAAYARLKADPAAWTEYQAEVGAWDSTLADGLETATWEEA